jgi:uncharacterized protein (TIGR02246 family)
MTTIPESDKQQILDLMYGASTAFREGDARGFAASYSLSSDVTLFGAKGGTAKGRQQVELISAAAARALGNGGSLAYEVLATRVSGDLAYVAAVERISSGAPEILDAVCLRVTQVFAREADGWRLLHRHADSLRESPFNELSLPMPVAHQ